MTVEEYAAAGFEAPQQDSFSIYQLPADLLAREPSFHAPRVAFAPQGGADSVDIRRMRQNREDEKRAYHTCQECIARHGLEMKLVEAEDVYKRQNWMTAVMSGHSEKIFSTSSCRVISAL